MFIDLRIAEVFDDRSYSFRSRKEFIDILIDVVNHFGRNGSTQVEVEKNED